MSVKPTLKRTLMTDLQSKEELSTSFDHFAFGTLSPSPELHDRLRYSELRGRLLARRARALANSRSWRMTLILRLLKNSFKTMARMGSLFFERAYQVEVGLLDEAIYLVNASGLFDEPFYREQLDRLSINASDCVSHFILDGWKSGLNPNPFFDCSYYVSNARKQDVEVKINPLLHYIILGSKLHLATSRLFDPKWYLANYPDLIDSAIEPLLHFMQFGLFEDRASIPYTAGAMSIAGLKPRSNKDQSRATISPLCNKPYDLVLCVPSCSRTGAPSLGLSLLQQLIRRNLNVLVVLLADGELLPCFEELADTVNLSGLYDAGRGLGYQLASLEASRQLSCDVPILLNSAENHQLIDVFANRGYKVNTLVHEFISSYSPKVRKTLINACHRMIFSSRAIAQDAHALAIDVVTPDTTVLTQGLIDESYLSLDKVAGRKFIAQKYGIRDDSFVVLACGTIELRKGIDTFISVAIDTIAGADKGRDIRFIWIGDELVPGSGTLNWVEVDLMRAGLTASVHLAGHQSQLQQYFAGADLFLLPSRQDPMPCVLHMAMAAQLPVVAFKNNGGAQEVLCHGGGTLVDYGSVAQMSAAILSYYHQGEKQKEDGIRGREVVTSMYNMSRYADEVLKLCGIVNAAVLEPDNDKLHSVEQVEQHYDRFTDIYVRHYGNILQSYRPFDLAQMMQDEMQRIKLRNGMRILDAGCGVCGPAIYFASKLNLSFECITISQVQVDISCKNIAENNLTDTIKVRKGDFHYLSEQFPLNSFDRVLFLEALCHSNNFSKALSGAHAVLKPGGCIYIKDFVLIDWRHDKEKQAKQKLFAEHSYQEYHYQMYYLNEVKSLLRSAGFRILEVTVGAYVSTQDLSQQISFEKAVGFTWREGEAFDYPVAENIMILAEKS